MRLRCIFDLAGKKRQLEAIEEESLALDFYADRQHAQRQMQTLSRLRDEVTTWESLLSRLADLHELAVVLDEDPDAQLDAEVAAQVHDVEAELERQRFRLLLRGEHDAKSAIISIHAGNGGTDAQDWVESLQRAYMRWADPTATKSSYSTRAPVKRRASRARRSA